MAATEYHKNMIYERIDEATSITDIIPMLKFLELETIKNIIKSQIETIAVNEISNIFHSSVSIETIFPMDVIQHITSFNNVSNIKSVSKAFNKCSKNNQIIQSKEFISAIQENKNKNKKNETWVVDKKRTKLNDEEIELKYKGPVNDLQNAIDAAKSGDKILIYDGKYVMKNDTVNINKALQIIGCGNVFLRYNVVTISNDIYFKNITIRITYYMSVIEKCRLFMENCDMSSVVGGIQVNEDGVLSVVNCNFYGGFSESAIHIHVHAKEVNVIGCRFTGFDNGCILLQKCLYKPVVKLKCVDNLFKNNSIPISGAYLSDAVFRDNKVKNGGETVDVLDFFNNKTRRRLFSDFL